MIMAPTHDQRALLYDDCDDRDDDHAMEIQWSPRRSLLGNDDRYDIKDNVSPPPVYQIANYSLNINNLVTKKVLACDRPPIEAQHKPQNTVLELSTLSFETARHAIEQYYRQQNIVEHSQKKKTKTDI